MRQDLRKRMVVAAAATGLLSLYGTSALADTGAHGAASNSPGVASGNAVEVPVTVPVNVCGNTVDAASLANPSIGNECGTTGDHAPEEARSVQDAPQRQAAPVAEPEYAPAAAADPEDSWEQAYEEYTRPDTYEESTQPDTHEQYIQPAEHPQYGDDEGDEADEGYGDDEGHGDDGYGDDEGHGNEGYGHDGGSPGGHEDTPGDYGDGPDTDEDTEVGYGDTPPTKPPHQPPTKPPTTKPPTTKPPTGHPSPTGKPPTTKPPVTTPPTTKPPTHHPSPTHKPPTGGPSTSHPPTDHPPTLPETGSDPEVLLAAGAAGLALIAGGSILYRRGRAASRR
ncbi:chaplin [Streptomyces scabiei]|uniref:chaplin n=4 Tax=Streptomyces scabiei TaxID=1930 RepID=UPI001B308BC4|nr:MULTISPECIES: chaplin [Streptomyces]MBP5863635.1 chaplin [Streptomyces sp. LBUM 1484]MBP5875861.1 chaplin [Streptomyces sp. LBUM 1477]MBP5883579.1 chaplin [Streptomyces sp. LBUM 1487]MBP5893594.1 chaplin [Streptomyces sp. LBUM 1481]MBP5899606.1 chaplin [Streptomyces sp. LBUM 1488]